MDKDILKELISLFKLNFAKVKIIVLIPIIPALIYDLRLYLSYKDKIAGFSNESPPPIIAISILVVILLIFYWDYRHYQRKLDDDRLKSQEKNGLLVRLLESPHVSEDLKRRILDQIEEG